MLLLLKTPFGNKAFKNAYSFSAGLSYSKLEHSANFNPTNSNSAKLELGKNMKNS